VLPHRAQRNLMLALRRHLTIIARLEARMVHYASKTGNNAQSSCGKPMAEGLHTVCWSDREQVNCPGCLKMLAKVETFFNEIFLPDDPERTCEISQALGILTSTPKQM
jgi:hypothetical protein